MKFKNFSEKLVEALKPSQRDVAFEVIQQHLEPFGLVDRAIAKEVRERVAKLKGELKGELELEISKGERDRQGFLEQAQQLAANTARAEANNILSRGPSFKLDSFSEGALQHLQEMIQSEAGKAVLDAGVRLINEEKEKLVSHSELDPAVKAIWEHETIERFGTKEQFWEEVRAAVALEVDKARLKFPEAEIRRLAESILLKRYGTKEQFEDAVRAIAGQEAEKLAKDYRRLAEGCKTRKVDQDWPALEGLINKGLSRSICSVHPEPLAGCSFCFPPGRYEGEFGEGAELTFHRAGITENCRNCGKHISHHFGGTEYRCHPRESPPCPAKACDRPEGHPGPHFAKIRCGGFVVRRDGTKAPCALRAGHARRCMEDGEGEVVPALGKCGAAVAVGQKAIAKGVKPYCTQSKDHTGPCAVAFAGYIYLDERFIDNETGSKELRKGLEKIMERSFSVEGVNKFVDVVEVADLQKLLDYVDSRDSLDHLHDREEEEEEDELKPPEKDEDFILRLAKRPSWKKDKKRLERIAEKVRSAEAAKYLADLYIPVNNPKGLKEKHFADHGRPVCPPDIVDTFLEAARKNPPFGEDEAKLCRVLDEEFLMGCWAAELEARQPKLLRDLRGLLVNLTRRVLTEEEKARAAERDRHYAEKARDKYKRERNEAESAKTAFVEAHRRSEGKVKNLEAIVARQGSEAWDKAIEIVKEQKEKRQKLVATYGGGTSAGFHENGKVTVLAALQETFEAARPQSILEEARARQEALRKEDEEEGN